MGEVASFGMRGRYRGKPADAAASQNWAVKTPVKPCNLGSHGSKFLSVHGSKFLSVISNSYQ